MPDLTPENLAELREQALMSRCYSGGRAVGIAPDELIALLDAAARLADVEAERDVLAAKVERARELADEWEWTCRRGDRAAGHARAKLVRALDATETDHA